MNTHQGLRRCLYLLKREYPGSIDIYKLGTATTDTRTGVKTVTKTVYHVPRAIVFPVQSNRRTPWGVGSAQAARGAMAGGTYDRNERQFGIDRRDVSGLTAISTDDWIVYDGVKYQIATVEHFEFDAGWLVTARALVGEVPEQILMAAANDTVDLAEVADGT